MGIKEIVAHQASKVKRSVTGGNPEQVLEGNARYPEEARGNLVQMREDRGTPRAVQTVQRIRSGYEKQFSSTFTRAVGGYNKQSGQRLTKKEKSEIIKQFQSGAPVQKTGVKGNIPRTRVPTQPQTTSFINRQIDMAYKPSEGYTSNAVRQAFSYTPPNKQDLARGLPSLQNTFNAAVGYKYPETKKKPKGQKFTFYIKK